MGIAALTQAERLDLRASQVIHLVTIQLATDTLYLANRRFRYTYGASSILYEPYLQDIQGLGQGAEGEASVEQEVVLTLLNRRWKASGGTDYTHLVAVQADQPFSRAAVTIHELRLVDPAETFASDVRTVVCKLVVDRPEAITTETFRLRCGSRIRNYKDGLGLSKITTALYPNADPDDVGQWRNRLYGSLEHVPCRAVVAGAASNLTADISAAATSITVSGGNGPVSFPATACNIQIDEEQIYCPSGFSSNQATGVTRGAYGTTAVAHNKGAGVWQMLGAYVYEIADHPVKTISAVYVDGVRQTSGFTAYTGQPGSQYSGLGPRAVIVFTVLPIVRKQVNVVVAVEHGHSTNTGSHSHTVPASTFVDYPTTCTGYSGTYANAAKMADGNEVSYGTVGSAGAAGLVYASMPGINLGTLVGVWVNIRWSAAINRTANGRVDLAYGAASQSIIASLDPGWYRYWFTSSSWSQNVNITAQYFSGSDYGWATVYEIRLEYVYTPVSGSSAATGVSASISGSTSLGGNSSADVVIGKLITVDVDGVFDDPAGNISGVAGMLLQRPDHIVKHALLSLTSGEIGANLVANPGFETDTSAWTAGAGATLARVSVDSGWRLRITTGASSLPNAIHEFLATGGARYRFSAYGKEGTTAMLFAYVYAWDGAASYILMVERYATVSGWTYIEEDLRLPEDHPYIRVQLGLNVAGGSGYTGYWDTVTVQELDALQISDIGATFSDAANQFETEQYKFAFITHDVGADALQLLVKQLPMQSRSVLYEWADAVELRYMPDSAPAADLTVDNDRDLRGEPVLDYTRMADTVKRMRAFYRRDYRGRGAGGREELIAGVSPEAAAAGYMDMLETSEGAADLAQDLKLTAVRGAAMAADVQDYWFNQKKTPRLQIKAQLGWRAIQLGPGKYISYTSPIVGAKTYRVTKFQPDRAAGAVRIEGVEA